MNGLDLFSGIGGISLALRKYAEPIAYCEIDPYCQSVLLSRMSKGDITPAPIWDNICNLEGKQFRGNIDIIYGGFPCQDISIAGHGKGLEGKRSGLFFEIVRLAKEIKPKFIFLENVPAITSRGGLQVVREITEMGYDCRWCVISAASVGALHRRERWFLLAHASSKGLERFWERTVSAKKEKPMPSGVCEDVANPRRNTERLPKESERTYDKPTGQSRFWEAEPDVGRVADGIPNRVDKLRALGNSVVPQQVEKAFEILMGINQD